MREGDQRVGIISPGVIDVPVEENTHCCETDVGPDDHITEKDPFCHQGIISGEKLENFGFLLKNEKTGVSDHGSSHLSPAY